MEATSLESRRGFLHDLLRVAGGAAAAAISGVGCAAVPDVDASAGTIESVPFSPGLRYANVMPDHLPAVRLLPDVPYAPVTTTSKKTL